MNLYKTLLNNSELTNILIKFGVIPFRYSNAIKIYTTYKDHLALCGKKSKAVNYCSSFYDVTIQTVYKIVTEMEEVMNED